MNEHFTGRGYGTPAARSYDEDPRPSEYDHRGEAERTAAVEEDAAERAQVDAEAAAELVGELAHQLVTGDCPGDRCVDPACDCLCHELLVDKPGDPGPVPVEPETVGRVTTIAATPRTRLLITEDIGRTGCTGLTVELATGEHVTVALPPAVLDALVESLQHAAPVHLLPAGGAR